MGIFKEVLDVILDGQKRRSLFFWPLILWVALVELASAYNLARGTGVRTWIEAILKPATEVAPYVVATGEVFEVVFLAALLLTGILYGLRKWAGFLPRLDGDKIRKVIQAEILCLIAAAGWTGCLMSAYQPGLPGCVLNGSCAGSPVENAVLIINQAVYVGVAVALIGRLLLRDEKKDVKTIYRVETLEEIQRYQ